ncbi:polysaccharide deacetylase family protein [Phytoactinopolyspora limicola]|uniref:polysaccharide deacetylase family protein n=1 Tax=Phytoactinopolyspora limicola TaxID=2715536 RepID=UPI00140CF4B5|nr:polysaccharide deacetylase family protein [Phytoactinopolyspora limicola]
MKVPAPVVAGLVVGLFAFMMANNGSADESPGAASPTSGADRTSAPEGDGTSGDAGSGSDADESGSSRSGGGASFPDTGGLAVPDPPDAPGADAVVTLTFDDGPHPVYTPQILDLLAENDATAVFCVVGEQVRRHPDLVRRIADDGHALCNHTDTHDHRLATRSADRIEREIADTAQAIADAAPGLGAAFFRQPGTAVTSEVAPIARRHGLTVLNWTVDPRDWSRPGAEAIARAVVEGVAPGAVILLHDGGGDRSQTVQALAYVLPVLHEAGYATGTPPPPARGR